MKSMAPSIFNDVIGPVMRGPSSSHVAGAARIASMLRQMSMSEILKVNVDFDIHGSLAESHTGHGTDMGFACGLLGIPLTDSRVDNYEELLQEAGICLTYTIMDYGASHPNHYRIQMKDANCHLYSMDAISTGGGMVEIIAVQGRKVSMKGDFYETCFLAENLNPTDKLEEEIWKRIPDVERVLSLNGEEKPCIEIKTASPLKEAYIQWISDRLGGCEIYRFAPVLPTHSTYRKDVPFRTARELLDYNQTLQKELWELALLYESVRGNTSIESVWDDMRELLHLMKQAADCGLRGTEYRDRILHSQAGCYGKRKPLIPGDVMNSVVQNITAIMEAKSSMNVIVAAPTCGSCGCLPGTVIGIAKAMRLSEETEIRGLLTAGLVGAFFAEQATFAAEVGGCQMECGAGSGMAAAAVTQMMGGTVEECLDAASMALMAITGLACDPVANRVEVPCLNKNVMGGMNALSSANMALSGFDKVIPLDETIAAIYEIGLSLPLELRCTFGGLGKTAASRKIREELEGRKRQQGIQDREGYNADSE